MHAQPAQVCSLTRKGWIAGAGHAFRPRRPPDCPVVGMTLVRVCFVDVMQFGTIVAVLANVLSLLCKEALLLLVATGW